MRVPEEPVYIDLFRKNPVFTSLRLKYHVHVVPSLDFAERDECKPVLLGLSLAGNLVKPIMSLYGTEWRERGYNGLR